jgi:DNA-binding CsgD family transcriptional regulator
MKHIFLLIYLLSTLSLNAIDTQTLLQKGWNALVQDKDVEALQYFEQAYQQAQAENDIEKSAFSLLNMAICTHGSSFTKGLSYCQKAMLEFQKLEKKQPKIALEGRSRCLQLMSTIYGRQGKLKESIALSKEALLGFEPKSDSMGYIGLINSSLGTAYSKLNMPDSAAYFYQKSLEAQLEAKIFAYLPTSYLNVGEIELKKGNKNQSFLLFARAQAIADSTKNKQAQVSTLLALGNWYLFFEKNQVEAESYYQKAKLIALEISDKSFYLKVLNELLKLRKQQGNYQQIADYQEEISVVKDSLSQWETQNIVKRLEIEFKIGEKDRRIALIQKEKEVTSLANYLLWGVISFLILIVITIILFSRKINRKNALLFQAKEELLQATAEKKRLKEEYLQNELEFKESQLSALTFQMIQKNELLQELKARLEEAKVVDNQQNNHSSLQKIIQKGMNQDREWDDFNTHFESINKNFYARLKAAYPEISPNDLKICALIKMNLSIKEMASILNISPDSVKTARYRLRKKLQMNTEDNLTDFILNIGA